MDEYKILKIDELVIGQHHFLTASDECYYLMNYSSGKTFRHNKENDIIQNFKKGLEKKGNSIEWGHKRKAIVALAGLMRRHVFMKATLSKCTFVPVAPSKAKGDPLYDDRLMDLLRMASEGMDADIRELVLSTRSTRASHLSDERLTVEELVANSFIDENLIDGVREIIIIFDDVLVAGAHFRAYKTILSHRFPEKKVVGIFLARRDFQQG